MALYEDFDVCGFTLWALLYEPKFQIRNGCTKLSIHLKESEKHKNVGKYFYNKDMIWKIDNLLS